MLRSASEGSDLVGAGALAIAVMVLAAMPNLTACRSASDDAGQGQPEAAITDPQSGDAATSMRRAIGDGLDTPQTVEFETGRPFAEITGAVLAGGVSDHVFEGQAGQVVMATFAKRPSGVVSMTLRGPDGSMLADAVADAVVELRAAGHHTISVNGAADTDYTLYVTKSTGSTLAESERITLETVATIDGTTAPGEIVQYEISAAAGQQLSVQVSSPTGRFITSARTSDGVVWLSFAESAFTGSAEVTRTAPVSGSHVVSLLSLGADDPTASTDYELRLSLTEPGEPE